MVKNIHRSVQLAGMFLLSPVIVLGSRGNGYSPGTKPNFIIIMTDDQGYNDLGCYGSETIRTPYIDRMAEEGMRFTGFYAQPVCGPSRGALMTGRYPLNIGGGWVVNAEELTIAELLKNEGYIAGCVGKWDMSGRKYVEGQIPNDQGFDYFFGTLGANDRGFVYLFRNRDSLYRTDDMSALSELYTDEAIAFLQRHREGPFFLYLAHTMPHVRIDASPGFNGKSKGDLYGDVIEEIDWNVGRLLEKLDGLGLDDNTFVIFLSDNGPWSGKEDFYRELHGGRLATGSAWPLHGTKGSPWEGGFRVPCIVRAPGRVPAGTTSNAIFSSLDFFPTLAALAGIQFPEQTELDGYDQSALIEGISVAGKRNIFYYHQRNILRAVRKGKWKLILPREQMSGKALLFDLEADISESTDLSGIYPGLVSELLKLAEGAPGYQGNHGQ